MSSVQRAEKLSLERIQAFLEASREVQFVARNRQEIYAWMTRMLRQHGYLRVDIVHQGDRDGVQSVYPIDAVDEVTQWQVAGAVVRKHVGCKHIAADRADKIQAFYESHCNPYPNFHRPWKSLARFRHSPHSAADGFP
jgi:hypothetical protein